MPSSESPLVFVMQRPNCRDSVQVRTHLRLLPGGGGPGPRWRIPFSGLVPELANEICFLLSFSSWQISTLTLGGKWAGMRVADLCVKAFSSPGSDLPGLSCCTSLAGTSRGSRGLWSLRPARSPPAERAAHSRQSSWLMGWGGGSGTTLG